MNVSRRRESVVSNVNNDTTTDTPDTTRRATNPSFQMCCSNGKAILRPLGTIPTAISDLFRGNSTEAKEFKQNIRSYNSALSFTSMNANLDRSVANNISGAYAFRIHDGVQHLKSSSLVPSDDMSSATAPHPKFAQIYIFDTDNKLRNRMNVAGNSEVDQNTMATLQRVMHDINPFVSQFKTMKELAEEQPEGIQDVRMVFRSQGTPDPRRYNDPTASEIGVLIVGATDNPDMELSNRDIVVSYDYLQNLIRKTIDSWAAKLWTSAGTFKKYICKWNTNNDLVALLLCHDFRNLT